MALNQRMMSQNLFFLVNKHQAKTIFIKKQNQNLKIALKKSVMKERGEIIEAVSHLKSKSKINTMACAGLKVRDLSAGLGSDINQMYDLAQISQSLVALEFLIIMMMLLLSQPPPSPLILTLLLKRGLEQIFFRVLPFLKACDSQDYSRTLILQVRKLSTICPGSLLMVTPMGMHMHYSISIGNL